MASQAVDQACPSDDRNELTPLLQKPAHPARAVPLPFLSNGSRHPALVLLPVIIGFCWADALPETTTIDYVRIIVCKWWQRWNNQPRLPPGNGLPSPELCDSAAVGQWLSFTMTTTMVFQQIGTLVAVPWVSSMAARFGRKRAMLGLLGLTCLSMSSLILSTQTDGPFTLTLLVVCNILACVGNPATVLLVAKLYVTDLANDAECASFSSIIMGAAQFGQVPSFALGGTMTEQIGSTSAVYFLSLALYLLCLLYTLSVPESLSARVRSEASRIEAAERPIQGKHSTGFPLSPPVGEVSGWFLAPLEELRPVQSAPHGLGSWTLVLCAIVKFFGELGTYYLYMSFFIFSTVTLHLSPKDTGFALSLISFLKAVHLSFLVPRILTSGRTFDQQFDAHFTVGSWLYGCIIVSLLGFSRSKEQVIAAFAMLAFAFGANSGFDGVVFASVPQDRRAAVLSSMSFVDEFGKLVASFAFGWVITSSMATFPQLVFILQSIALLAAAIVMLCIRDSARTTA